MINNNWAMAWVLMFPKQNAGFAYDTFANVPAGWNYPYPYYTSQPLGVYSSSPYVTINDTYFYPALWFQQGKYGFGSPQENLTLSVNLYEVPQNDSTTFWAFGYNAKMVSITQGMKPLETSYITITPNADSGTSCMFDVPSSSNVSCGKPNPAIVYVSTNNSADVYGANATYSALDTNTGQLGWVFETAQNDSLYSVSNNKISLIKNEMRGTPTGITFDPTNNVAYFTSIIPDGGPGMLYAVSGQKIVNTPISSSLQSSPQTLAYDQDYNYLYVSVSPQPMSSNTQIGIEVFNPDSGKLLSYIPTGDAPSPQGFAYDQNNGNMFALVPKFDSNSTVDVVSGLSISSSFTVSNSTTGMTLDPNNGYLYLSQQNGDIFVVNPSNGSPVGTIYSVSSQPSPTIVIVYDSYNEYMYAFESGEMLVISGAHVLTDTPTQYYVTSAFYDPIYNNILAFH